jgi:hypothetical protein
MVIWRLNYEVGRSYLKSVCFVVTNKRMRDLFDRSATNVIFLVLQLRTVVELGNEYWNTAIRNNLLNWVFEY